MKSMPNEQTMQNLYRYYLIEMRNNKSCFIQKLFYLNLRTNIFSEKSCCIRKNFAPITVSVAVVVKQQISYYFISETTNQIFIPILQY